MDFIRDRVSLKFADGTAWVTLARPDKHNALDLEMFLAIVEAQKAIASAAGTRVVILSGAGEDFCSGLDVKSMFGSKSAPLKLLRKWLPWKPNLAQKVSVGWRRLDIPVIAAIQGRCWGGGLQIALGADFRVAHPNASLSIMEGKWGLIPDMGGTLALRELMPRDHAMQLAMTAEIFDAARALEFGLLSRVSENPLADAEQLAARLQDRSPDAIAAIKKLFNRSWQGSEGMALARETAYQLRILAGANQRIAVKRQQGNDTPWQ